MGIAKPAQNRNKTVLPRSNPNAYIPPYRRLRPTAPEFVPLGIAPEPTASNPSSARRSKSAAAAPSESMHKKDSCRGVKKSKVSSAQVVESSETVHARSPVLTRQNS